MSRDVTAWLNDRLAPRRGYVLPLVCVRHVVQNPISHEQVPYTLQSVPDVAPFLNDGETTIPAGFRSQVNLGERTVWGVVAYDTPPGGSGQIMYESATPIVANDPVTLPDGRSGTAASHIAPGETGIVLVPTDTTILAGTQIDAGNGRTGYVVADIAPGESGEAEVCTHASIPTDPSTICGAWSVLSNGARVWYDWAPEALTPLLDAGLPAVLPDGPLTEPEFETLLAHVAGNNELAASLQVWRDEGLI